jgi:hypothetical protein
VIEQQATTMSVSVRHADSAASRPPSGPESGTRSDTRRNRAGSTPVAGA